MYTVCAYSTHTSLLERPHIHALAFWSNTAHLVFQSIRNCKEQGEEEDKEEKRGNKLIKLESD